MDKYTNSQIVLFANSQMVTYSNTLPAYSQTVQQSGIQILKYSIIKLLLLKQSICKYSNCVYSNVHHSSSVSTLSWSGWRWIPGAQYVRGEYILDWLPVHVQAPYTTFTHLSKPRVNFAQPILRLEETHTDMWRTCETPPRITRARNPGLEERRGCTYATRLHSDGQILKLLQFCAHL